MGKDSSKVTKLRFFVTGCLDPQGRDDSASHIHFCILSDSE